MDLVLFLHGTEGVELAPTERWLAPIEKICGTKRLIGVDAEAFPGVSLGSLGLLNTEPVATTFRAPTADEYPFFEEALKRHGSLSRINVQTLIGSVS